MIEKQIIDALEGIAAGGVYFDAAPQGTKLPYVTLSQVGGDAVSFLTGRADQENARIQIDVFAGTRPEANHMMNQVVVAVCDGALNGEQVGAPFSAYESTVKIYRRSCDFSFWYQA
jgi:hypothetical protein